MVHRGRRRLRGLGDRRPAPCRVPVRSDRPHHVSASSWAFSSPTLSHPACRSRAAVSSASESGCRVRILPESNQQSGHCGSSAPESTSAVLAPADTQTCQPQSVHSRTLLAASMASPTAGQTSRPARFRRQCLPTTVPLMISTKSTADDIRAHKNRPSARRRQAGSGGSDQEGFIASGARLSWWGGQARGVHSPATEGDVVPRVAPEQHRFIADKMLPPADICELGQRHPTSTPACNLICTFVTAKVCHITAATVTPQREFSHSHDVARKLTSYATWSNFTFRRLPNSIQLNAIPCCACGRVRAPRHTAACAAASTLSFSL